MRALLLAGLATALAAAGWYLHERDRRALPAELAPFTLEARPQADRYLFDYARVISHYEEGAHRFLGSLRERFHIEALIVSVPELPADHDVATLANDLANRWHIGEAIEGRGLLLLLVDDAREVKLEVGYQLEDVFTDAFTGYVEDLQLGPYYRAGDLGTGLVAVMELLEERAALKRQGAYTPDEIASADGALLAGGAGARRALSRYADEQPSDPPDTAGSGAASPEAAWQIMLSQWAGERRHRSVDTYTAMTRLAMGDPSRPDPRVVNALDHWRNASYEVRREGDHAVIWFGAVEGWHNAPFLFCNTGDGWKFDIVHQRRLVVMAEAPRWQISQGPYPYVALMPEAKQTTSKDLPLPVADRYRCADDAEMAARMAELEAALERVPDSVAATLELMRLNVVTGQRPNFVMPLVKRAKSLAPRSPAPYRYAAIYHVNTLLQYETALAEIGQYLKLTGDDAFGYNMKGFLLYRLGRYRESIDALEKAALLIPEDAYAYSLMARDYILLARRADGARKRSLEDLAIAMQREAAAAPITHPQRLLWLDRWLAGSLGQAGA